MIFRPQVLQEISNAYDQFSEYFRDIRSFFEVLSVRFSLPEYGTRLTPVAGKALFSNANSYLLSDDSAYPYYLWLPSWLGRFYIDAERIPEGRTADDCRIADAGLVAFVWPWLGFGDAYVQNSPHPECWFGVTDPRPQNPDEPVLTTAQNLFNHFRLETTFEAERGGWLTGGFHPEPRIDCNLTGTWYLRRVPLSVLTDYYQVEKNVIRPLGEKFTELSEVGRENTASFPSGKTERPFSGNGVNGNSPKSETP
ncbi:hypothetical protein ABZ234_13095 [Nocardiopsis sp. NPDC006198]|uniref:hypothetical protein n=1 Tax=Nocardiopsis sp. NPDC006198 TaxID=3154472 RepID=UPI0033A0DB9A